MILLGILVVDATTTLLRRLLRGKRPEESHHDHAYQHAERRVSAHLAVTLTVGAINLFWLLPVSGLVATESIDGFVGVLAAYAPLVFLAVRFKAGVSLDGESVT